MTAWHIVLVIVGGLLAMLGVAFAFAFAPTRKGEPGGFLEVGAILVAACGATLVFGTVLDAAFHPPTLLSLLEAMTIVGGVLYGMYAGSTWLGRRIRLIVRDWNEPSNRGQTG